MEVKDLIPFPSVLEKWNTLSLPLLPGPLWPGLEALNSVLSMDQIELFDILNCANKWFMLNWIAWNRTV